MTEVEPEFELFGARTFEDPGFAVPLFRSRNFGSNAIYCAVCEVGGDLNSNIVDFEITDLEPDIYLDRGLRSSVGDKWLSVFVDGASVFAGVSKDVWADTAGLHEKIQELAPLSYLELAIGARSAEARNGFKNAEAFLEKKIGEKNKSHVLIETCLRRCVRIPIARCFSDGGVVSELPRALSNFVIKRMGENSYYLRFSHEAFLLLDEENRASIRAGIEEYFSLLGLTFVLDEKLYDYSEDYIQDEYLHESLRTRKRTRRFGLAREIAIDLGTTNTRLFSATRGLILEEPSVVAVKQMPGVRQIVAVGSDALLMEGRTPQGIMIERPLRDGAIADLDMAVEMIKHFIKLSGYEPTILRPLDVFVCVPAGSSSAERRAIAQAARSAGAAQVSIILQPMAAAIGADAPVMDPVGFMILTMGGGTTEVAIIAMNGVAYTSSSRMGGDSITDAIMEYFRRHHNLMVGRATAEKAKRDFGVASSEFADENLKFRIRGRDVANGILKEIEISQLDFSEAFNDSVKEILELIRIALENAAPELSADLLDTGLLLAGGGARLAFLDKLIESEIGLPVTLPSNPQSLVAQGIGIAMNESIFTKVLLQV